MSKTQEVGDELFEEFQTILPSPKSRTKEQEAQYSRGTSAQAQILSEKLDRFYARARTLREKHRLGLISRARVVRHFQTRMMAAGHDANMVHRVVLSLILSAFVGRAKKPSDSGR